MQLHRIRILSFTLLTLPIADFITDFVDYLEFDDLGAEGGNTTFSSSRAHGSNITWREQVKLSTSEEVSAMGWTAVGTLGISVRPLSSPE